MKTLSLKKRIIESLKKYSFFHKLVPFNEKKAYNRHCLKER